MKGNVILLNPHIPSIGLSKIAFSYGIGRAAKLSSIEKSIEVFSDQLNDTIPSLICDTKEMLCSSSNKKVMLGQLLSIQQRVFRGSRDGLLGTNGLHWAKPELEGKPTKQINTLICINPLCMFRICR